MTECRKRNLYLVSIENNTKLDEINTLVLDNFGRTYLWIGGYVSRYSDPMELTWLRSGQVINFTYWLDNYPTNTNKSFYCILIGLVSDMKWINFNCDAKNGFICESIENTKIQDMEENLEKLLYKFDNYQKLMENLTAEIKDQKQIQQELEKQKDMELKLKQLLKHFKYNDLKECVENLYMKNTSKYNLQDEQLVQQPTANQLNEQLQKENYLSFNFYFQQKPYNQPIAQALIDEED